MRLRLAVVAVALLVSFGVQARDLGVNGDEYIRKLEIDMKEPVKLVNCGPAGAGKICIYAVGDSLSTVIGEEPIHGNVYVVSILCEKTLCRLTGAIRVFMRSSPVLAKYSDGLDPAESWEALIDKAKANEYVSRVNCDVDISIYFNSTGRGKIYMSRPK
jgi:hypothetical protein